MSPGALIAGATPRSMASAAERRSWAALWLCAVVILLDLAVCKGFVEDLMNLLFQELYRVPAIYMQNGRVLQRVLLIVIRCKDNRKDDIWLVDFYAPWCGHCKKLEPIWNEVGLEMKSIGSPVKVGKMDATSYSSIASEFGVRGYPTIKLAKVWVQPLFLSQEYDQRLKGDLAYNYRGPRTKDDIIEFAHRVSGALIRPLPSQQMFDHVRKRHCVFFVYIGEESPLKEKYIDAASELIVYTYFFSASEDVVPNYLTLKEIPAVLVFKDNTYFVYDEYEDGDLSTWISRERFQNYLTVDGFLLYELGDTGKLVAIAVIDEKNTSLEHTKLKSIVQEVARDFRDHFHRDFQFGHMDGNDYINTLLMECGSRRQRQVDRCEFKARLVYKIDIKDASDMVQFINSILDGTVPAQGGDSILQRLKRIVFDAKSTIVSIFKSSPLMGCFLFGLPLGVISIMCYGIYTADTDGGYIEERYEVSKSEMENQEQIEENKEQESSSGGSLVPAVQEPKDVLEKKKD